MLLGGLALLGVVLFLSMMSSLDLLFIRLEEDPVWLPDLGPDDGVNPRPPLARTFLPGLTTLPAGALELLRADVLEDTPGDFLMVGPFLTTTSCSLMITPTEILRAAEAFSKDTCIEDFLFDFLLPFNPADSLIACSNTLTLSLTGDPVYPPTNLDVELLCLSAGDNTWAASCLTLGDATPFVSALSEQELASCFCFVLVDLEGLASSPLSVSLAVFSSSVEVAIFCLVLDVLTDLFSVPPSVSLAV